jgi:hypothetical protein
MAHESWVRLGNPDLRRFTIVANPTIQFVSLDGDTNWLRWPLPLVHGRFKIVYRVAMVASSSLEPCLRWGSRTRQESC